MDNFSEQLVKREPTSSDRFKRGFIYAAGVLLTALLAALAFMPFMLGSIWSILCMVLAAGSGYATFFFIQGTHVEYEYTFTNGELDIDKIVAKKKRTPLISTEVRKFTAFGKYNENLEETSDLTVVISSDNIASHEYYAEFIHAEYGNVRLIFSPNEVLLENIRKFMPASLRNNF